MLKVKPSTPGHGTLLLRSSSRTLHHLKTHAHVTASRDLEAYHVFNDGSSPRQSVDSFAWPLCSCSDSEDVCPINRGSKTLSEENWLWQNIDLPINGSAVNSTLNVPGPRRTVPLSVAIVKPTGISRIFSEAVTIGEDVILTVSVPEHTYIEEKFEISIVFKNNLRQNVATPKLMLSGEGVDFNLLETEGKTAVRLRYFSATEAGC